MVVAFTPDRGDIVWLSFNAQQGHEQAGRRPALVVTPKIYNSRSGLLLACPITSKIKGYPFEVRIKVDSAESVVLVDQIRSFDWQARKAKLLGKATSSQVNKVQSLLGKLIS